MKIWVDTAATISFSSNFEMPYQLRRFLRRVPAFLLLTSVVTMLRVWRKISLRKWNIQKMCNYCTVLINREEWLAKKWISSLIVTQFNIKVNWASVPCGSWFAWSWEMYGTEHWLPDAYSQYSNGTSSPNARININLFKMICKI